MSAGAGIVVSRAVIRDMFPPADAQRVMSQVTIYFGVAPAVAPMVGGLLFVHAGWHCDLLVPDRASAWCCGSPTGKLLPETLHAQPAGSRSTCATCCAATGSWARNPRFLLLALASGIPFNGMFLYVLSAPVFLGEHLQPRRRRSSSGSSC